MDPSLIGRADFPKLKKKTIAAQKAMVTGALAK
jgi:hypothetical protein